MTSIERMCKVLDDRFKHDVGWRNIETQWVTPSFDDDTEVEWGFKPSYYNISYDGSWTGDIKINYTYGGNYSNKTFQPKLQESYPRENLDMLFGLDGG